MDLIRISTKGRFKSIIPGPGDTYKQDIQIFKKSKMKFLYNNFDSSPVAVRGEGE